MKNETPHPARAPNASPPTVTKMASLHTNEPSCPVRAPIAEAIANIRRRSASPSASTNPAAPAPRMIPNASSRRVSPERSIAVSPDSVIFS